MFYYVKQVTNVFCISILDKHIENDKYVNMLNDHFGVNFFLLWYIFFCLAHLNFKEHTWQKLILYPW